MLLKPLRWLKNTAQARRWRRDFASAMRSARGRARPGPFEVVMVLDGLRPQTNAPKIIRSADALGAREVVMVGMEYINPIPTCGALDNIPVRLEAEMSACLDRLRREGYRIVALEPRSDLEEERYLDDKELPEKTAFIVGHESDGVSFAPMDHPDVEWVAIRQHGQIPCMNAGVSAGIALYEYSRQHGRP